MPIAKCYAEIKEKLKHSKQAEVILEDVELSTFSDGMVSLQIQDSYHADNNPSAYDFEVDIKGLEYTTKNKDISNEKKMPNPDDTMALLPTVIGVAQAKVRLVGKDPVFIVVNETTNDNATLFL